ncbi:MAG: FMN-dependent NADH-azoreductase [Planctomycetota bacterium]|jgi:FMN-dependent NADH-azoreductase
MSKVLYIQASPRKGRSKSTQVATAFLEAYQKAHPDDLLQTFNVFDEDLPAFDGPAVQAKYTILHGAEHTDQERQAWDEIEKVIDVFKDADKYVFSLPMWNFGIPYRLKQFFDVIIQPGYTFTADSQGYEGLMKDKPITVVYSRGGAYPDGSEYAAYDLQKPYMETVLGFMGFENIQSIIVEPTMHGAPEDIQKAVEMAIQQARQVAEDF